MLYRDEVQPSRLTVEVKGEALVLQTACPPWLVEHLKTDQGLQVFSRQPSREHQRLLDLARRPENILQNPCLHHHCHDDHTRRPHVPGHYLSRGP